MTDASTTVQMPSCWENIKAAKIGFNQPFSQDLVRDRIETQVDYQGNFKFIDFRDAFLAVYAGHFPNPTYQENFDDPQERKLKIEGEHPVTAALDSCKHYFYVRRQKGDAALEIVIDDFLQRIRQD